MADPCRCPAPNRDCRRAGYAMDDRALWGLCSGASCTPALSEKYRTLWDGLAAGTIPRLGGCVDGPPERPADCIYLGTVPLERTDAAGVACECAGKWLFPCDLFGACRVNDDRGPAVCCQTCPDYVSDRLPPV